MAIDGEGRIVVSDSDNNRVLLFDFEGNYILQWGQEGSVFFEDNRVYESSNALSGEQGSNRGSPCMLNIETIPKQSAHIAHTLAWSPPSPFGIFLGNEIFFSLLPRVLLTIIHG